MLLEEQRKIVYKLANMAASGFTSWSDYGNIRARYKDEMVLLSYTSAAGRNNEFNPIEQVCRGLILDTRVPRIIAWPFEKFFNVGERGKKPTGYLKLATEKIDGSLGIFYIDREGLPCIATKGAFDSEHALWATEHFREHHWEQFPAPTALSLAHNLTYLFEIVTPQFRNVVDYGDESKLVLLAARTRDGTYVPYYPNLYNIARYNELDLVKPVSFHNVTQALERAGELDATEEGWVLEMSNGERWKVKGDDYVELHRVIHNISLKRAFEYFCKGKYLPDTIDLPEEHEERWNFYMEFFINLFHEFFAEARELYAKSPNDDRKTFAKWATSGQRKPLSSLLFGIYDNKSIDALDNIVLGIMKRKFKNGDYDFIEESYNEIKGNSSFPV